MKAKVLKNIINLAINRDITPTMTEDLHIDLSRSQIDPASQTEQSQTQLADRISDTYIWDIVTEIFKFDDVSKYMLSNFSDAIHNENFEAATQFKEQILKRWYIHDDDFYNIGKQFLLDLENGCLNSKIFEKYTGDVKLLLIDWRDNGFKDYDYIMEKLIELDGYIENEKDDNCKAEVRKAIFSSNLNYNHPVLIIRKVITFFKLLKGATKS